MFPFRFPWSCNPLSRSSPPVPPRAARPRRTPFVELLEDRWLPSAITHVRDIGTFASSGGIKFSGVLIRVFKSPVAAGHSVVVEVATGDVNSNDPVSVSDDAGNAYTLDADVANPNGGRALVFEAQVASPLPVGSAIDVHFNVPVPLEAISVSEFAGLDAANPVAQTLSNTGNDTDPNNDLIINNIHFPRVFSHELVIGAIGAFKAMTSTTFTPNAENTALPGAIAMDTFSDTLSLDPEFLIAATPGAFFAADGTLSPAASWADGLVAFNADTATHFSVTPAAGDVPAGRPFSVTVTALDDGGHAAAGYTGTAHFSSSDALAGLPADYTFTAADHGSHTFTAVLGSHGPQSIQVRDVLAASLTGSGTVTATPFDATAQVAITKVKVVPLPDGDLQRKLTLRNAGADALPGPVWVVFDHLGRHTRLRHRAGVTAAVPPLGSPYAEVMPGGGGVWNPGASLTVVLTFADPLGGHLRYVPRVLVGPGTP